MCDDGLITRYQMAVKLVGAALTEVTSGAEDQRMIDDNTRHLIVKSDWTNWKRSLLADLLSEWVQSDEHCAVSDAVDDEAIYRLQEELLWEPNIVDAIFGDLPNRTE
ncbi:MAG: hypothetical protein KJ556_20005 [Gammaproteobacteria bacterium]|nr:hypothetical protein [Gammaproteobacteria bacterium]